MLFRSDRECVPLLRQHGQHLEYVYEVEGDTLTIWGGEWGSPAYYRGILSKDGTTLTGAWHYPGGGYEATSTRIE